MWGELRLTPELHPLGIGTAAPRALDDAIKSTFRMSRSAAAGSHAAGTPGHAPGGGAGRCVPGQSARQYEGQGPMDFAAFTGTPGGMPMAFVRCYARTDGQSHV